MENNDIEPTTATISASIPSYNPTNIPVWFSQLNALFSAKKVTSQVSRYAYVVEKLPTDVAAEVVDLLDQMPEDKPYDKLKNAIIRRMGTSDGKKLHDLFNNLTLGHMKPSQLLRKMKSLLGDSTMSETVLKKLWTDKLNTHTTQILASLPDELELEKVSEIADKIHDNSQDQNVYATTTQTNTPDKVTELSQCITNLTMQVQNLMNFQESQRSRPYRSSSRHTRTRSRSNSFSREQRNYDTCWYHYKFGQQARKCTKPCNFNSKTSHNFKRHQGNDHTGSN